MPSDTGQKDSFDIAGFSGNVISDFGPVLSLFGEQAARQFMSQSMGWSDNIIFAMAPLGIITAIVGAIRVGGPTWLKAIIGRARENRALAEIELMSSTSHEVCELWNGHNIVRLMGSPEIRELIHFSGGNSEDDCDGHACGLYTLKRIADKDFVKKEVVKLNFLQRQWEPWWKKTTTPPTSSASAPPVKTQRVEPFISAPNVSLNLHNRVERQELHFVAVGGAVIQLGVLVYAICAVKYPGLKDMPGFDRAKDWALFLMTVGTGAVVAGMLLCSYIIEQSTIEERYRVKRGEVHILWVQKAATVNDQVFDSYATFAKDNRRLITTSRRNNQLFDSQEDGSGQGGFEYATVAAVLLSFFGFMVQFIGLRGMHWTVSVAHLGATLLMTALRAFVRRGLAKQPHNQRLPEGHEIDWLATRMAKEEHLSALWKKPDPTPSIPRGWRRLLPCGSTGSSGGGSANNPDREAARSTNRGSISTYSQAPFREHFWSQRCLEWSITTGIANPGYNPLRVPDSTQVPEEPKSQVQKVVETRQRLGVLTRWPSTCADQATSVATAIEAVMNTPGLLSSKDKVLVWSMNASGNQVIEFTLERREENGRWEANLAEIEAVLSLWQFSIEEVEKDSFMKDESDDKGAWLRSGMASRKQGIRLLGPSTTSSRRDMKWWMGSGVGKMLEVNEFPEAPETDDTPAVDRITLDGHQVVGFGGRVLQSGTYQARRVLENTGGNSFGDDKRNEPKNSIPIESNGEAKGEKGESQFFLATMSEAPQGLLFAQDMFSAFMWAFAQSPNVTRIDGQTTVQTLEKLDIDSGKVWRSFTLQNTTLSKMVDSIQKTGLGNLDEIYMCILPPLSTQKRLPDTSAVVDFVHQHTRKHDLNGNWEKAAEVYLWTFIACATFGSNTRASIKATAGLTEFLRSVSIAADTCEKQQYTSTAGTHKDLETLRERLARELSSHGDRNVLRKLAELYERQERTEGYHSWKPLLAEKKTRATYLEDSLPFGHTKLHLDVLLDREYKLPNRSSEGIDVNRKDILGWTPFHYAARRGDAQKIAEFLEAGADWNAKDIGEWTPLHYAASSPTLKLERSPVRDGANVNAQGRDGFAPLHCAARSGNSFIAEQLVKSGANLQIHDNSRRTPLHWAAYDGFTDTVTAMIKNGADVQVVDDFGRTPLHLAAMRGFKELVVVILDSLVELDAKDGDLRTSLQMAASNGHEEVAGVLLDKGAEANAVGGQFGSALQAAAANGHEGLVKMLLDKGVEANAVGSRYGSAMQAAAAGGRERLVKMLLDNGADVNVEGGQYGNALQAAAAGGHEKVVKLLLDKGAIVSAGGGRYGSALQAAAANGHETLVEVLLDNGADVNVEGGLYGTALHAAVANGHETVVKLLADNGADTTRDLGDMLEAAAAIGSDERVQVLLESAADLSIDHDKYLRACQTAASNGHDRVLKLLLEKGADVIDQPGNYSIVLEAAAIGGHGEIAQLLLKYAVDSGIADGEYRRALQAAAVAGDGRMVQILLLGGADVNAQGGQYGSVLQAVVAVAEDERIVRLLVESGANVNAQGGLYGNALQAAVIKGYERVVELLLENGADVTAQGGQYGGALQAAVMNGNEGAVRLLLRYRADVNTKGGPYGSALQAAAANGYGEVVQLLAKGGVDVNAMGGQFGTALQAAAANGYSNVVQILVDIGADLNAQGGEYGNALHASASGGHLEVTHILLRGGADINAQGGKYGNSLQAAAAGGHLEVAQILLDNGANPRAKGGKYGNALHAAAAGGHLDLARLLLEHGANPHAEDSGYGTAPEAAATAGHLDLAVFLLEHGPNVTPTSGDKYGNALPIAAAHGYLDLVKLLLEHGANANTQRRDRYGNALHTAAARGHMKVVEVLLGNGANPNAQGGEHGNALLAAAAGGHPDLVRLLWKHGANVNTQSKGWYWDPWNGDKYGNALHAAATRGHLVVAQILLDQGANPSAQGGEYGNALQAAAAGGHLDLAGLLVEHGADVDATGGKHGSALRAAVVNRYMEIVQMLLEKGADVNAKGGEHGSALQAAIDNGHSEVEKLLRDAGAMDQPSDV